jgi:hypothetical protein
MPETKIVTTRGSVIWAMNSFRQDALTNLMHDLLGLENRGLRADQCQKVRQALDEITNVASAIPDGGWFKRAVWQELQDFSDVYQRWNSHEGSDAAAIERRKTELRRLRDKRNRIARRIRNNQYVLQHELDLKLVENIYGALGNLASALPDIFSNLSKAVARFAEKKVGG